MVSYVAPWKYFLLVAENGTTSLSQSWSVCLVQLPCFRWHNQLQQLNTPPGEFQSAVATLVAHLRFDDQWPSHRLYHRNQKRHNAERKSRHDALDDNTYVLPRTTECCCSSSSSSPPVSILSGTRQDLSDCRTIRRRDQAQDTGIYLPVCIISHL